MQKYLEEKLIIQKQKYGLVSNQELKEKYDRQLDVWEKEENEWMDKKKRNFEQQEDLDYLRKKRLAQELDFIETEREMDFIYSAEEKANRQRRQRQWEEDLKSLERPRAEPHRRDKKVEKQKETQKEEKQEETKPKELDPISADDIVQ